MKKILISFFLLVLASCGAEKSSQDTPTTQTPNTKYVRTYTVTSKTFSENIKLTGKVSASKETSIAPQMSGVIKTVNVQVGDRVYAGQVLATIDTQSNLTNVNLNNAQNTYNNTLNIYNASKESLQKNLEAAQLQLQNAKNNRDNIYATSEKQLELAQQQLESVLVQESNTNKSSESNLALMQKSLESAQLNLENFYTTREESLRSLEAKKENIVKNMQVTIDSAMVQIVTIFDFVDPIFGISDKNKNTTREYESYLWFRNASLKSQVVQEFSLYKNEYLSLKDRYDAWSDVMTLHEDIAKLIDKLVTYTDAVYQVLEDSTDGPALAIAQLNGWKQTIKWYQTQIVGMKSSFVQIANSMSDVQSTITTTTIQLETQEKTLQQALATAQANLVNTQTTLNNSKDTIAQTKTTTQIQLENTIASIQSQRDNADNAVKVAQTQFQSAQAQMDSQLASLKSQLDNASGARNSLNQQVANATIKAPFDGIITAKNVEIGSSAAPWQKAFGIAASTEKIIKMDVSSQNAKYLTIGKEVEIRTTGKSAMWIITLIGSTANETNNLFPLEISFSEKDIDGGIRIGDFVTVYVQKEISEEKVLTVPFSALMVGNTENYSLYVVDENGIAVLREVKVGAKNSFESVITQWIQEGERVVIRGVNLIAPGDILEEEPDEVLLSDFSNAQEIDNEEEKEVQ